MMKEPRTRFSDSPFARFSQEDAIHLTCLQLLADGHSLQDIASRLEEATTAIEFALSDVRTCLGAVDLSEAVTLARQRRLIR